MKIITMQEAVNLVWWKGRGDIYALISIGPNTSLEELAHAEYFCTTEDEPEPVVPPVAEQPEPVVEQVEEKPSRYAMDHERICGLYKGNRSVAEIAEEMGCSDQTVRNH